MQLIEHLVEKTYFHTHQIVVYVQAEFGIRYTVAGIQCTSGHIITVSHGFVA
ncbi:transposase [Vibrio cholerae CT 5369-93]|nr:transposase [Vibrio cholerae CT 5369-93]